jgi:hypothetical protein
MIDFRKDIISKIVTGKKYPVMTDYARITFGEKGPLKMHEYEGESVRVFKESDTTHVLCPKNMDCVMENAVTEAISSGKIFDDAEDCKNMATCVAGQVIPCNAVVNRGRSAPDKINLFIQLSMGEMNPSGSVALDDTNVQNGANFAKEMIQKAAPTVVDLKKKDDGPEMTGYMKDRIMQNYCGTNGKDIDGCPELGDASDELDDELESVSDVTPEDSISDDDYDEVETGDDEKDPDVDDDDVYEESFFTKKPKKLKPIPRSVIAYITVETNAVQDSHDQAMISGYTCSKLELVDFYLNVLDQHDDRYIVPHTRDYLVSMQAELNRLLAQILKIRPVNKNDRVWQVNVNYPENWRG